MPNTHSQFAEKYKTFTNSALLAILSHPEDYQPAAVQAARLELDTRQLSEDQVDEANAALANLEMQRQAKADKILKTENKLKNAWYSVFDLITPLTTVDPDVDKLIRSVSVIFALVATYKLYNAFGFAYYAFTSGTGNKGTWLLAYLLPTIVLPVSVLLLWLRKQIGWVLLAAYLVYILTSIGINLFFLARGHGNLVPGDSIQAHITSLLFYGGFLMVLYKRDMRVVYRIDTTAQVFAVLIGITLVWAQAIG